jgi:mannose-6-phosphate isomerase-like protein (cupin superfamily)
MVPPGSVQWVVNSGSETMTFLCLVEPAWKQDDEEVLE